VKSPEEPIGLRLHSRRVELGLTLAQVAEKSGLSLPYVSNLERGRGNPTIEALRAIATALQIELSSLIGNSDGDPLDLILAQIPKSLHSFSRTTTFGEVVAQLAKSQGKTPQDMRQRILIGMASAPRRSQGEPTEDDWRRLLDAYSLILKK